MKKLLAILCIFAMLLTVCGCTDSTTVIETSVYSTMEGDEIVGGTISTNNGSNKENTKSEADKGTANKNNASEDDKISTGSNSVIDNPLNVDLKGAKVTIYDAEKVFKANTSASKAEQAKDKILKQIEKELNCKLVVKTTDREKLLSLTTTAAAGGEAISGIVTTSLYHSGRYISQNLVANVNKVSSLDLSKSYMNKADVLNATQFGNGRYAIGVGGSGFAVFYNKRILKELGYKDNYLYDMVDKGKWTYSEFRRLAKEGNKELDGKSGMSENDQWGSVVQDMSNGMMTDILVSMGTTMVKQQNGQLKLNMTDPKILKVVELSRAIYSKDGIRHTGAQGDNAVKFFGSGKALFLSAYGIKASLLTNMKDEFGVLPAPKVDGAKKYSQSVDWNYTVMMIPAGLSAKDQYNAGAVIQAYMYLYDEVENAQKKEYTNRYFCDKKSGDNWLMSLENGKAQPNQCYAQYTEGLLSGTYRVFWNSIEKGESAATLIESSKSAAQKALDELNKRVKDK